MIKKLLAKHPAWKAFLKTMLRLNFKTIRFNFHYFSFKEAIRFPVYVSGNVRLQNLTGKMFIEGKKYPGMIKIGYGFVGHFDKALTRGIWDVAGTLCFKGSAQLRLGSKIIVARKGYLELGNKFIISPNTSIICYKEIIIGNDSMISWDSLVMDTDFHKIKTLEGDVINAPRSIVIGNKVWIGVRTTILKGAKIPDHCIVAAGSVVSNEIKGSYQIIGGVPAKTIKTGVTWEE